MHGDQVAIGVADVVDAGLAGGFAGDPEGAIDEAGRAGGEPFRVAGVGVGACQGVVPPMRVEVSWLNTLNEFARVVEPIWSLVWLPVAS